MVFCIIFWKDLFLWDSGSPGHTWIAQKSSLCFQCVTLSCCVPMQFTYVLVLVLVLILISDVIPCSSRSQEAVLTAWTYEFLHRQICMKNNNIILWYFQGCGDVGLEKWVCLAGGWKRCLSPPAPPSTFAMQDPGAWDSYGICQWNKRWNNNYYKTDSRQTHKVCDLEKLGYWAFCLSNVWSERKALLSFQSCIAL